jgi:hypothetical protein
MKSIFAKLSKALLKSWSMKTCYPKCAFMWSQSHPSIGQCAITALVVQDYLGGIIKFSSSNNHFFNFIREKDLDLTKDQFFEPIDTSDAVEVTREWILWGPGSDKAMTLERYSILSCRVRGFMMDLQES